MFAGLYQPHQHLPTSPACANLTSLYQPHQHLPTSPACANRTSLYQPHQHLPTSPVCANLTSLYQPHQLWPTSPALTDLTSFDRPHQPLRQLENDLVWFVAVKRKSFASGWFRSGLETKQPPDISSFQKYSESSSATFRPTSRTRNVWRSIATFAASKRQSRCMRSRCFWRRRNGGPRVGPNNGGLWAKAWKTFKEHLWSI